METLDQGKAGEKQESGLGSFDADGPEAGGSPLKTLLLILLVTGLGVFVFGGLILGYCMPGGARPG